MRSVDPDLPINAAAWATLQIAQQLAEAVIAGCEDQQPDEPQCLKDRQGPPSEVHQASALDPGFVEAVGVTVLSASSGRP